MQYDGLAWAFALLALLAALVAVRILFERTWFLGWLRGTCGLAFVAVAALLLVLAWDLRSYSLLKPEQPMATLSFQAEGPQRYRVLIQGAPTSAAWCWTANSGNWTRGFSAGRG